MGTDCAVIAKAKGENKVFRHSLDRLYCFDWLSAGDYHHHGLRDDRPEMEEDRQGIMRMSDKIDVDRALMWAAIRLSFLSSHKRLLETEIDFWYHVRWVGEFIGAVGALANMENIEFIALADDNCDIWDELVIYGDAEVIDF
jgi:hypothetical protein